MSTQGKALKFWGVIALSLFLLACNAVGATRQVPTAVPAAISNPTEPTVTASATATSTATASPTATPTITASMTGTPTVTASVTATPTETPTPTQSPTPSITPSPTFSFPTITVLVQANCRYGPGKAYLYAWGMYPGDTGTVWGRNAAGTWLWIQPDNINYQCWIAASVVEIHGDIFTLRVAPVNLPHSTLYGPPEWVNAVRDGDEVIVTWDAVWMTEDDYRGYMIEATVCQNGNLVGMAVATTETTYTFTDETSCDSPSHGLLYAVEKHGYTDPVAIAWP